MSERSLNLALIGQPNVGKSTVFNHLTGMNQHVGNWPGKTVERKTGSLVFEGREIGICDLPGTYSLTANSEEERIARDYIIREKPDVVLLLVNAAALERSLYLLSELMLLEAKVVVGLNMADVAKQHGMKIDVEVLRAKLGIPVAELVASKNIGLKELLAMAIEASGRETSGPGRTPVIKDAHKPVLERLEKVVAGRVPAPYPEKWVAVKLLEGDREITELSKQWLSEGWLEAEKILEEHEDAYLDIVGGRYEWISSTIRKAVERPRAGAISVTDRLDRFATHPVLGIAILLAMLTGVFYATYALASPLVDLLGKSVALSQEAMKARAVFMPPLLSGLVFDGFFSGAGMVLSFLPTLVLFFFFLGLLEDVGYLSRVAYIMDNFMHKIGLHGKSFVPLFLGFGCNVPAIMGTRIIEDKRARTLTILLAPLVPCTARLAVLSFMAPAFFGGKAAAAMIALVMINIAVLFAVGKFLSEFVFKGVKTAFIMELPLYHAPNFKTIYMYVYNNVKSFIAKAASIIVLVSGVVWFLSAYPGAGPDQSYLAEIGKAVEGVGKLMGFPDWRISVALLTSFVAKENTIATLGVLFGTSTDESLAKRVSELFTFPAAMAFLVVQMLFIPCLASVTVIKKEAGLKWAIVSTAMLFFVSIGAGIVTYQLLRFFNA